MESTSNAFPHTPLRLCVLSTILTSLVAIGFLMHSFSTGNRWWVGLSWLAIALANVLGIIRALKRKRS